MGKGIGKGKGICNGIGKGIGREGERYEGEGVGDRPARGPADGRCLGPSGYEWRGR